MHDYMHVLCVHPIYRQIDGDVMEDDDMQFVYSNQSTTHLAVYTSPTCGFTEGTASYCIHSDLPYPTLLCYLWVCVLICHHGILVASMDLVSSHRIVSSTE